VDQIDCTGTFEVFSRIPNASVRLLAKHPEPMRDVNGLVLTPDTLLCEAPALDVLHVPGGYGRGVALHAFVE
jgi:cyclohexyl-isocyanide hydratase